MEKKELNKAAQEIAAKLEAELKATVPVRTGRLQRSIKAVVNASGEVTDIIIEGESYINFLPASRSRRVTAKTSGIKAKPSSFGGKKKGGLLLKFEAGPVQKELDSDKIANAYANDVEKAILKAIDRIFNK